MIDDEAMEDYRTRFDTEITPVLEQLSKVRKAYFRRVTQDARLDGPDRVLLCTHTDAVILYSLLVRRLVPGECREVHERRESDGPRAHRGQGLSRAR